MHHRESGFPFFGNGDAKPERTAETEKPGTQCGALAPGLSRLTRRRDPTKSSSPGAIATGNPVQTKDFV
jgi:hypothetical protein